MVGTDDRILVLDSDGQAGLSVVRSLGRAGASVTAGSSNRLSLGRLSRFSDDAHTYSETTAETLVTDLVKFLRASDHFAVVPVVDHTTVLLSKYKDEIEETGTIVAAEEWETFQRTYDKSRLFELAEPMSVPTPRTYAPTSLSAVESLADDVPYPSVIKPRSKTTWDDAGRCHYTTIDDAHYVDSPTELLDTYRTLLDRNPILAEHPPLVQEYVDGTTVTTVLLADEGDVVAHFQEERIRTYPSSGGNSTVLKGSHEPRMLEYAREVIDALEWTGPAMVEFMRTPEGEFYLIEVNGRYWGSLPFAIASGIDLPRLHYQQLRGREVDAPSSYRTGFRQQRLLYGDLKWLAERLGRGDPKALPQFLWTCLSARQTFVSLDDPVPTVGALCQAVDLSVRAATRHLRENHLGGRTQNPSVSR